MLKRCLKLFLVLTLFGLLPSIAQAQRTTGEKLKADLIGFEEVPAISTTGTGTFTMVIEPGDGAYTYTLTYSGLTGSVQQAHTHIAQKGVNGGIMIFYCTNLGNGPAGTQACPLRALSPEESRQPTLSEARLRRESARESSPKH